MQRGLRTHREGASDTCRWPPPDEWDDPCQGNTGGIGTTASDNSWKNHLMSLVARHSCGLLVCRTSIPPGYQPTANLPRKGRDLLLMAYESRAVPMVSCGPVWFASRATIDHDHLWQVPAEPQGPRILRTIAVYLRCRFQPVDYRGGRHFFILLGFISLPWVYQTQGIFPLLGHYGVEFDKDSLGDLLAGIILLGNLRMKQRRRGQFGN